MNAPESKLFNYLSVFPRLGDLVKAYGTQQRKGESPRADRWLVGQGFSTVQRPIAPPADPHVLLQARASEGFLICRYVHSSLWLNRWERCRPGRRIKVRRRGFERGFSGPRVLIPRGVDTSGRRLRATYLEAPLTFQHIHSIACRSAWRGTPCEAPDGTSQQPADRMVCVSRHLVVRLGAPGGTAGGAADPSVSVAGRHAGARTVPSPPRTRWSPWLTG